MKIFSSNTEIEQFLWGREISADLWLLIIALTLGVSFWLYRREPGLKKGLRIGLMFARIAIVLLVIATLFEPRAAIKETRTDKRSLAIMIDESQSMAVRDQRKLESDIAEAAKALSIIPYSSKSDEENRLNSKDRNAIAAASRLDIAKSLLSKSAASELEALSKNLNLHYYSFGESLNMLGTAGQKVQDEIKALQAIQAGTAVADALGEVANAHRDGSLAGIVVLTDGIETNNGQPEEVARAMGIRNIPIYTIPTGIAAPDDVSIRNIVVQDVAFIGDTVPIRLQLNSKGYEKRTTDLVVRFNEKEVARETVTLDGGLQYVNIAFDANVRSKRSVALEVEIEAFADEATAENNLSKRTVRVVNEKINVLCIEGSARWEFRYLRAILKRDPRINSTFIATRANNELALHASDYIARFPEEREDAFKYDLIILGDVESSFFSADEFSRLEELVRERGGSLLMLAGAHHSPSSYAGTVVEKMLPVHFDAHAPWGDIEKSVYPVLTTEGKNSLVLTLEDDPAKNDSVWSHMAPMDRLPPLQDPRPGASVLATLSDSGSRIGDYPLISWQRYGTGKCMLIATDRLWRLRFRTGDKYHWRLWSQCIQFLTLSRLLGEHKQIRMETDRASYAMNDQVRIYAEVLDDGYEPVLQDSYDVFVGIANEDEEEDESNDQKTRISLRPDTTRPGLYEGYFTPSGTGRYRLQANEDDIELANTIEFQVADLKPEMAQTGVQMETLKRLSELSGGKTLQLSQVNELGKSVDQSPYTTTVQSEEPLWDNWLIAILLIALTGLEWIVRRRHDLL